MNLHSRIDEKGKLDHTDYQTCTLSSCYRKYIKKNNLI